MGSRRMAVLVNPMAGAGAGADIGQQVIKALEKNSIKADEHRTSAKGDAVFHARAIARDGYDAILSVGGDGTLHEVINGLLTAPEGIDKLPALGLIPVGTGNDYIKMHGGPMSLDTAISQVIEGKPHNVDVGVIEDGDLPPQYFINNIGGGFLAEGTVATEKTHKRKGKRGGGKLRYVSGGLKALMKHKPVFVTVATESEIFEGPFSCIHVGLGRFCGGGIDFIPEARVDDGDLSLCLVHGRSRLGLASIWLFLERGGVRANPGVIRRSCQELELSGQTILLHADGELYQIQNDKARIRVLAEKLQVLR
jgi:diacylglycerol kinase (ATP)